MNYDDLPMPKQTRLGYINWNGEEEEPVLVERLRDKPLGSWLAEDMAEEAEAGRQHTRQAIKHAEQQEWIIYVCTPLWEQYPDAPISRIIKLLPEPDRTIAEKITYHRIPREALPLERTHREPWHERIEYAIFTFLDKCESSFSVSDILTAAGVDEADRPYAYAYAKRILDDIQYHPADVTLPWFPQQLAQQSNRPQ
jgi:hypothetical protein